MARRGLRRWVASLLFVAVYTIGGASATEPTAGVEESLQRARARHLHQERYWQILLHYRQGWWGTKSLVDDPNFFLDPEGRSDPVGEMAATIAAFYQQPEAGGIHPRCRFPARFHWLLHAVPLVQKGLPAVACEDLTATIEQVAPRSVGLVFTEAYMSDPASLFGHALLRVESSYDNALFSQAINYAAQIDPRDNGITYTVNGIFGRYRGYYSISPYYETVRNYSHMDQRDIWEYRLNLTQEETRRLFLHAWELQQVYTDFFFLDENCSFSLLYPLEAARPSAQLSDQIGPWVTPLDAIQAVIAAGLVTGVDYRPSRATKIRHRAASLGGEDIAEALRVVDGETAPSRLEGGRIAPEKQARILDLASEYLQLRFAGGHLDKGDYQSLFHSILLARSKLAADAPTPLPVPTPPDQRHGSQRLSLGVGSNHRGGFLELTYRPVYHDLLDSDVGFPAGSMIEVSTLSLRQGLHGQGLRLQRWDWLHILSLAPRDDFFRPVSWKVRTGLKRRPFSDDDEGLLFTVNPGGGFAWGGGRGIYYLLGESELDLSRRFDGGYTVGVGLTAGWLTRLHDRWRVQVEGRGVASILGDTARDSTLSLRQSFRLRRNMAVRLGVERRWLERVSQTETQVSWRYYF